MRARDGREPPLRPLPPVGTSTSDPNRAPGRRAIPPGARPRRRRLRSWGTALLVVGGVLLTLFLVAAGVSKTTWVEESVRVFAERLASEQLESRVTIGGVAINVFTLELSLEDVEVIPPSGGRLFRAESARVSVALAPLAVLLRRPPELDTVELIRPEISLEIADGKLRNLPPPILRALEKPSEKKDDDEPFNLPFRIERLSVRDATVRINVVGEVLAELSGLGIDVTESDAVEGLGFDVEIHADGGGVEMARLHESLRELAIKATLDLSTLAFQLHKFRLVTPRAAAHISGSANLGEDLPRFDVELSLATPLGLVSEGLPEGAPPMSGQVVIDGHVSGTPDDLTAGVTLDLVDIHVAKFSLPQGHIRASLEDNGVSLDEVRVKVGKAGTGIISGFVGLTDAFPFRLDAEVEGFELSFLALALGLEDLPVEVVGKGKATVTGEIAGERGFFMEGNGEGNASELVVDVGGGPIVDMPGAWGKTRVRITPEKIELINGRGGVGANVGAINATIWFDGPRLDMKTSASSDDLSTLGPIAGLLFGGAGSAVATIRGRSPAIEVIASGSFNGASVDGRPIGEVTGEVKVSGDTVTVTKARLVRGAGRLDVPKLVIHTAPKGAERIFADLGLHDQRIEELAAIAGFEEEVLRLGLAGGISGWGRVEGPLKRPDLNVGLVLEEVRIAGESIPEVRLDGSYLDGLLRVENAVITKGGGKTRVNGTLDSEGIVDATVEIEGVRVGSFAHPSVAAVGFDGVVKGTVAITGPVAEPRVGGDVLFDVDGGATVKGRGHVDLAGPGDLGLNVEATRLSAANLLRAALSGGDLARARTLDLPHIPGHAEADIRVEGSFDAFAVRGRAGLRFDKGGGVNVTGDLEPDGTVDFRVLGNALPVLLALRTVLGIVEPSSGMWRGLPEVDVKASVDGELEGPLSAPAFDGSVTLAFAGGARASATGRVDAAGPILASLSGSSLSIAELVPLAVALADPANATENLAALPPLSGSVTLSGSMGGTLTSPELDVSLNASGLVVQEIALGSASLNVDLGRSLKVGGKVLDEVASLELDIGLEKELPFSAALSFRSLEPLRYVPGIEDLLPSTVIDLAGRVVANGKLARPDSIRGGGKLTAVNVTAGDLSVRATTPMRLAYDKGVVSLDGWTHLVAGADAVFAIAGAYDLAGEMDFSLVGNIALSLLPMFVPGGVFTSAVGVLAVEEASITGTAKSPEMTGRGRVAGTELGFSFFPDMLRDFSGDVNLSGNQILLSGVSGYLNSGRVGVNGSIDLADVTQPRFDLAVDVREADIHYPEEYPSVVDGRLLIVGDPKDLNIRGDFEVLAVNYSTTIDWKPTVEDITSSRRKHRIVDLGTWGDETESDYLTVDIVLRAPEGGIYVKNNLAEAEAFIDSTVEPFRIHGTPRVMAIEGTIRTKPGGYVYLFDKEFEIVRGEIAFADAFKINPVFDIEAVTEINEYTVTVTATGPVESLDFTLTSEPSLPPDDIAVLITFGASREELESAVESGAISALGASEVGGALLRKSGVAGALPFDISLGTRFSDDTGTFIPVVKASKRISKRLRLTGSTSFVDPAGDFEAGGVLKLGKRLSLHGTYSAADDSTSIGGVGFDVRWKKKF